MPGKLSTHVLDTMNGRPAANLQIELFAAGKLVKTVRTNADGRAELLTNAQPGNYEIIFHIGDYFGQKNFLDKVPIHFRISDAAQNYHVPLLCTPWAYSTYRGT
ncbi:MAG: 5-hydroxyisourate hydrolase [Verrucomicrobiae bacterium]|nr:5-hydroxyisourate hydrolase [Verrucomicrobiae bacterium]